MRTRNAAVVQPVVVGDSKPSKPLASTTTNTRSTRRNPVEVLNTKSVNTPAKRDPVLPRGRGPAKNVDKENVSSAVQDERGKPPKQATILPEAIESLPLTRKGRGKKPADVAVEQPKTQLDAPKRKGRAKKQIIENEESPSAQPVADEDTLKSKEAAVKEAPKTPDPPVRRGGRAKKPVKPFEDQHDQPPTKITKIIERQEPPSVPEKVKSIAAKKKKIHPPTITAKPPSPALVAVPESPKQQPLLPSPSPAIPSSSVSTNKTAIVKSTTATPIPTPAMTKPQEVPLQRSPVYLPTTTQPIPVNNNISSPPSTVQKRSAIDDSFQLMPLKPRIKRQKVAPKTTVSTTPSKPTDPDDVYGFDFNESSEPQQQPQKKKKQTKGKTTATTKKSNKPRQNHNKIAKKQEPTTLKLWDEKDFNQRQRQIKINLKNKDFKQPEKPIPPPQQFAKAKPQMNSTMKDTEPEIIPITDEVEPEVSRSKLPELSHNNLSIMSSPSKLIPWRYSTIRNASSSLANQSLNNSNAENMTPSATISKVQSTIHQPLHTLQPQRSPMKELNPNETILVPRPLGAHKFRSPMKPRTTFGLENNFGFESDTDELDEEENLDMERRKIDDKIDSLKRFRHSLNAGNSSSPVQQPARMRNATAAAAAPRQMTGLIRNIFTSTPQQQVTIREAFEASTPIAGPSRRPEAAATKTTTESNPKLFESLTFEAPPKRNYSLLPPKRKRRVDFLGCSDDDGSEDEADLSTTTLERSMDEGQPAGRAKHATKKSKVQKVQEEKLAQFVDEFNSMCDEVDQYEMVIE